MKTLGLCAAALVLSWASSALAAPQCFEMRFRDAKGVIVPVTPAVVGMPMDDLMWFDGTVPSNAKPEKGRDVACTEALIGELKKTFEDHCLTEDRRKKAVAQAGGDQAVVTKRCAAMLKLLDK